MATCTFALGDYNTASSPRTIAAFTPAAGDLLVVIWWGAGTSGTTPTCTSTGNTAAWTKITDITFTTAGNNGRGRVFVQNALATAVSTVITLGDTGDETTGNHVHVWRIAGMTKTGATAVRQSAVDNSHAAGTPMVTALASAALTTNPVLVSVHDEGTATGYTAPTSWTEAGTSEGISTVPTQRSESASRDSGFTGTTVTWGTASTGVYGSVIVEFDASGAAIKRPILVMEPHRAPTP